MGAENRVSKGVGELVKGEGEKGSQKKSGAESTSSNQPIQLDSPAWPSPFFKPPFYPPLSCLKQQQNVELRDGNPILQMGESRVAELINLWAFCFATSFVELLRFKCCPKRHLYWCATLVCVPYVSPSAVSVALLVCMCVRVVRSHVSSHF